MRRCQCPLACGKRHKCLREVAETVRVVREEEFPQQDIFYEKDRMIEVQGWREHCGAHKPIHGVCEPTCSNQVSL